MINDNKINNSTTLNNLDMLMEWVIWGNLDSLNNIELILLKGHLLIEIILNDILRRHNILNFKDFSFYRKIILFKNLKLENSDKKDLVISSLQQLNNFRNKLAHEYNWEISNGEFEQWATKILNKLKGKKFTKYTYRTRFVHSFSILANNIIELSYTTRSINDKKY